MTDPAPGSIRRWAILVAGSINFVLSMFYRVSVAVVSPQLVADLALTGGQLSTVSACFYYAFALSQVPVGIAIDRLGPRRTLALLSVAALSGGFLFALGTTAEALVVSRILLGIGMSGNLMVVYALMAVWFPVDRFGFLGGIVVSVGVVGNLLAATPLAAMSLAVGWRCTFVGFAVINAVIVAACLIITRDRPPGAPPRTGSPRSLFDGLRRLVRMYRYWAISLSSFVRYGFFAALQGLWAGPFLIYGIGMGEMAAGNVIFSMGLGYMLALPLAGYLSDLVLRSRKKVILGSMILTCMVILFIATWTPQTSTWIIYATFFVLGAVSAPGQIAYAHIKELVPRNMLAQTVTALNFFTVLGAGVMTQILGLVLGGEPSGLSGSEGFRGLWYVGAGLFIFVSVLYWFVPESRVMRRASRRA